MMHEIKNSEEIDGKVTFNGKYVLLLECKSHKCNVYLITRIKDN